jgi:hypothetical protein
MGVIPGTRANNQTYHRVFPGFFPVSLQKISPGVNNGIEISIQQMISLLYHNVRGGIHMAKAGDVKKEVKKKPQKTAKEKKAAKVEKKKSK